jgi:hypothetical protein
MKEQNYGKLLLFGRFNLPEAGHFDKNSIMPSNFSEEQISLINYGSG